MSDSIFGGDKFTEYPIMPVEKYFAKNQTGIRNLFVLTDDWSIIQNIRGIIRITRCTLYAKKRKEGIFTEIS